MRQNRLHYFLVIPLFICFFELSLTGTTQPTVEQQVNALNQRLEQNLLQSNKHLENSEFHQAEVLTTQVLADLDILLEATMPLDERINQLIENEEIILNETKKLKGNKQNRSQQKTVNKMLEDLIFDQVKNREKTELAATLTQKQLEATPNKPSQSNGRQGNNSGKEKEVLIEVQELLNKSVRLQTSAIDNLEEERFKAAVQFEADALETLKEALEKLRQQTKSQAQAGNNKQSGQQKNDQNQASKQQQQQQASQQPGKEKDTHENAQKESLQKKKMEAEEALKQLARLRKKAREEQERRKRQFGIQESGGQIPVEKDW